MRPMFHRDGSSPPNDGRWIFVFGSNLSGHHGAGAALVAFERFGASRSVCSGPTGQSYAIPTKGARLRDPSVPRHLAYPVLPLEQVRLHVQEFLVYARTRPDKRFFVTRVGAGLAANPDEVVARLFDGAPSNCSFADRWAQWITVAEPRQDSDADGAEAMRTKGMAQADPSAPHALADVPRG